MKPLPIFLIDATSLSYAVVNPEYVEKYATADDPDARKWMNDHDCETGPFRLCEYVLDQKLISDRFEGYWGGSKGGRSTSTVDKVVWQIV